MIWVLAERNADKRNEISSLTITGVRYSVKVKSVGGASADKEGHPTPGCYCRVRVPLASVDCLFFFRFFFACFRVAVLCTPPSCRLRSFACPALAPRPPLLRALVSLLQIGTFFPPPPTTFAGLPTLLRSYWHLLVNHHCPSSGVPRRAHQHSSASARPFVTRFLRRGFLTRRSMVGNCRGESLHGW